MGPRVEMSRRTISTLAAAGFLAVTVAVAYLLIARPSLRPGPTPPASDGSRFQPLATSEKPVKIGPREGTLAPSFSAPRFSSGTLSLADLRGKGVVMNFFASWCTPCRLEAHDLEATYRKYRARGIVFLGVDIQQDDWDDARDFLEKFGITYPAIRDVNGEVGRKFQLVGLPTTYFIDKSGIVRSKFVGAFLGAEGLKELDHRIEMVIP